MSRDRGIPQLAAHSQRGYAAKALDKRLSDYPLVWKRGSPLFLPPARTGLGGAQGTGQGTCPLRVLRAEP